MKKLMVVMLLLSLHCSASDTKNLTWQTGTLVDQSTTLEDAGCAGNVCGGTYHRTHYAIAAGNKLYIGNRTGSALNISVNSPIKFAINGNTIYLMDDKGKPHDCHLEQVRNVLPNQEPATATTAEPDATVAVISTAEGADINVDDVFVGNAPASLKLKPGKHTIKVTKVGYKDWSREMTALSGSQVSLNVALEKLN
jgi:hypothetical protein